MATARTTSTAPTAPKPIVTTGTLTNPGGSKKSVSITGVPKKAFNYLAGGPVFEDPYSGARLMVYHAEVHGKSTRTSTASWGLPFRPTPTG